MGAGFASGPSFRRKSCARNQLLVRPRGAGDHGAFLALAKARNAEQKGATVYDLDWKNRCRAKLLSAELFLEALNP